MDWDAPVAKELVSALDTKLSGGYRLSDAKYILGMLPAKAAREHELLKDLPMQLLKNGSNDSNDLALGLKMILNDPGYARSELLDRIEQILAQDDGSESFVTHRNREQLFQAVLKYEPDAHKSQLLFENYFIQALEREEKNLALLTHFVKKGYLRLTPKLKESVELLRRASAGKPEDLDRDERFSVYDGLIGQSSCEGKFARMPSGHP